MFSPLRNRFGIPGVISVIALVFAMLGGAYAASNDSGGGKATASAKAKKGPRGPRGPKGPAGPQGPAGPAGAKGDKGDTGAAGKDGAAGAKGATGNTGPTGNTGATGVTGEDGACSEANAVCVLPAGATETGAWAFLRTATGTGIEIVDLSFNLQLSEPPEAIHFGEPETEDCPGTFAEPDAAPGQLCLYPEFIDETILPDTENEFNFTHSWVSGASVGFITPAEKAGFGTWAVTAAE
ncbi:MAG TPA: hypothetical protein VIS95_03425 [Solirubrobacterales bacterium]